MRRKLDEEAEANKNHGQGADKFHRFRLVRQASRRKAFIIWRVRSPGRTAAKR